MKQDFTSEIGVPFHNSRRDFGIQASTGKGDVSPKQFFQAEVRHVGPFGTEEGVAPNEMILIRSCGWVISEPLGTAAQVGFLASGYVASPGFQNFLRRIGSLLCPRYVKR